MGHAGIDGFLHGYSANAYRFMGAHLEKKYGESGVQFRVYAPNALCVELIGECNDWQGQPMERDERGVYHLFIAKAWEGMMYKYRVHQKDGKVLDRSDPFGFCTELRPASASIVADLDRFSFDDRAWMDDRNVGYRQPVNIYELHFGSWRKKPLEDREQGDQEGWYSYVELCDELIGYLQENHFTHVELLPLSEHPFDGSWGYQVSGYFSVTSRYGRPEELQYFVDQCHQHQIGVIMDFVPVHFVVNDFALWHFDGTPLYEYEFDDVAYSEWGTCNFNFFQPMVHSFLMSAANFWLDVFHVDGLRMDAINHAIYWQGNSSRGTNIGAVEFLQKMNARLHQLHQGIMLIAEDSSNFLKVTAPVAYDGLGFDYKWDLGWMNDTLSYFSLPPSQRPGRHHQLTFSMSYFYNELFLLPLSHDEVVHGKKSIVDKMYGAYEEKFAQCRTLYTYLFTHPGKKLNFMGNELGHFREWDENQELDWNLLRYPMHDSFREYFKALARLYQTEPALYQEEYHPDSFQWLDADNSAQCVYTYLRKAGDQELLVVINGSDCHYPKFRVGLEMPVEAVELLNSDAFCYSGGGHVNEGTLHSRRIPNKKWPYSLEIDLAAYGSGIFRLNR